VGGLQDAMRVQAGVVGNIDSNRAEMAALVGQSQGATGALQATQAGNQLLALQSQQLSDLIAVISANGRADALTEAERATAAEQGREQRGRFLRSGRGYQPGTAKMFNNGNNSPGGPPWTARCWPSSGPWCSSPSPSRRPQSTWRGRMNLPRHPQRRPSSRRPIP